MWTNWNNSDTSTSSNKVENEVIPLGTMLILFLLANTLESWRGKVILKGGEGMRGSLCVGESNPALAASNKGLSFFGVFFLLASPSRYNNWTP